MGDISKLGWQIGLVKHATWADSLYLLFLLLLATLKILPSFPSYSLSFVDTLGSFHFSRCPSLTFCLCSWSRTVGDLPVWSSFTENGTDAMCRLLCTSFQSCADE